MSVRKRPFIHLQQLCRGTNNEEGHNVHHEVRQGCDRQTWRDFLHLPYIVYRNDENWVAPIESEVRRTLDRRRNPYFSNATVELFVCYSNGNVVARTAVIISKAHGEKFASKTAFFGFFESLDDLAAVRVLFERVERYCIEHGIELLEGPFNPNHYSELGLQIDAFDKPPSFFQTYNPAYYPDLLQHCGFVISTVLLTARNASVKEYITLHYGCPQKRETPEGFTVRTFETKHRNHELEILRDVFNDAFSENWHYIPVSREEYKFSAKFLQLVTEPELVTIVEHDGNPVGVLMCMLDINPLLRSLHGKGGPIKYLKFIRDKKKLRSLIVYAVGIRKSYQHGVVFRLLLDAMVRTALHFDTLETTWMSPSNVLAVKASERLGMKPDKHFVIYEKPLTAL